VGGGEGGRAFAAPEKHVHFRKTRLLGPFWSIASHNDWFESPNKKRCCRGEMHNRNAKRWGVAWP